MIINQPGLIVKDLASLKDKRWYNQRFDGCLNLIWMISEAELLKEARKTRRGHFTSHLAIFENHRCDWYINMADIARVTSYFIKQAEESRTFGKRLIKKWQTDESKYFRFLSRLEKISLSRLSGRQLADTYRNLTEVYLKTITSSSLIDGFALGSDEIIQARISRLLDKRKIVRERGIIFAALTAPVHQSFINEAELALLNIAVRLRRAPASCRPALAKKLLAVHARKYFWIKNNYHDNHILSARDFAAELKALLTGRVDLAKEIRKIKDAPRRNLIEKKAWLARLEPEGRLRNLLELSEDFTHWQDERKKRTFLFTHYASSVMAEAGRRLGYSLSEMKYLVRPEVISLLDRADKPAKYLLKERVKKTFVYQKGNRYEAVSGPTAAKFINNIFQDKDYSHIQDFRGLTASTGIARGRVRIVKSVKEVGKVEKGDILVAVMTRPDYIVGLKKAAAIVTDEGGITCHAAIISRELGIPCIIGTKIGTKALSDGDLVEVNANHGWVRKIS